MSKTYVKGFESIKVDDSGSDVPEGYILPSTVDPFEYTLSIIEGKWKMKIVYTLANTELMRYSELKRTLAPITHKMLSVQLKELERDGLVIRTEYQQIPPRVEYSLSPKGDDMISIFKEMWIWGHKYKE